MIAFLIVGSVVVVAVTVATEIAIGCEHTTKAACCASLAVRDAIGGMIQLAGGHPGWVVFAGFAGFWAWRAWRAWQRRPPRKRSPEKATGRVRDLGHRLVVDGAPS